jgi:hypothetical protein
MMVDLTKLSDKDLEAVAAGRLKDVSTEGLRIISGEMSPGERVIQSVASGAKQVAEAVTPERPQELMSQIGRQLGLTGRSAVTGGLSLPTMASDALVSLVNMLGGNLPMPSQAQQALLNKAGVPEPKTPQERVVQDIAGAGFGVLGGAGIGRMLPGAMVTPPTATQAVEQFAPSAAGGQAVKELLTQSPRFQAAAGGAAAGASALTREEGAGPVEQVLAGLGAGMLAPSAGAAAATAGGAALRGGRELVRPFTEGGREVIVGNVLRQLARDPEAAAQRMEAYQPGVPGYQPTTAQASRDIGLAGAVPAVRSIDTTGRFAAQQMQANQARSKILDRMAKDEEALAAAKVKRDEVTTPLRDQAFANVTVSPETFESAIALNVNKTIDDILASPVGKRKTVKQVLEDARAEVANARTPDELYEIRKDLRIAAQGLLDKSNSGGPTSGAFKAAKPQLESVIRAVDETIESAAPGYREYLRKYAASSKAIESMEEAQAFRTKVTGTVPVMTEPTEASQFMLSQPSFVRALRNLGEDTKLSDTQVAVLRRVGKDLDEGATIRLTAEPGSNTFKNMSIANFIGASIGKQMFGEVPAAMRQGALAFNWLFSGPDDKIREIIVDAMLDPKLAARMMRRANNAELIPISQELQRRAMRLGYGSVFGLNPE